MRSEIIYKENAATIEWDENYFKYCEFVDFSMEGEVVSSDFIGCSFRNLDWYMALFSFTNFINCRFINCIFQGTGFPDTRFVDCTLIDCKFVKDNLNRDCYFTKTSAYNCQVSDGEGFNPEIRT